MKPLKSAGHSPDILLTDQQRKAVLHNEGAALLLAVPGSGKTTVIVCRAARLVQEKRVEPQRLLTLTFSKAAAQSMKKRYANWFGHRLPVSDFRTIHSLAYTILKQQHRLHGEAMPEIIGSEQKYERLRNLVARQNPELYLPQEDLQSLEQHMGFYKNSMSQSLRDNRQEGDLPIDYQVLYRQYEQENLKLNQMDYDDMLVRLHQILASDAKTLQRVRQRYDYIQLDEAQDTSLLQHEIIRIIAQPADNLFMVGDEDQSIYSFRAAQPGPLLEFHQRYPSGVRMTMDANFRSGQQIVQAANRVIRQNKERYPKQMKAMQDMPSTVDILRLGDWSEQPEHIASQAAFVPFDQSFAVLYRNNDSAIPIVDGLDRAGLDFSLKENIYYTVFENRMLRDVILFLRLAREPSDRQSFASIVYKLFPYSTRQMLQNFMLSRPGKDAAQDFVTANPDVPNAKQRIEEIGQLMAASRAGDAQQAIRRLADELWKPNGGQGSPMKLKLLLHLAKNTRNGLELLERIERLEEICQQAAQNVQADIVLGTIHSAKGLEYDQVIIADAIDDCFPSRESKGNASLLEEERRLFYVASTRAKQRLLIMHASFSFGDCAPPCPFIAELLGKQTVTTAPKEKNRSSLKLPPMAPGLTPYTPQLSLSKFAPGNAAEVDWRSWEGAMVEHKTFGRGQMYKINHSTKICEVTFPQIGRKKLHLPGAVKNGLLKKL